MECGRKVATSFHFCLTQPSGRAAVTPRSLVALPAAHVSQRQEGVAFNREGADWRRFRRGLQMLSYLRSFAAGRRCLFCSAAYFVRSPPCDLPYTMRNVFTKCSRYRHRGVGTFSVPNSPRSFWQESKVKTKWPPLLRAINNEDFSQLSSIIFLRTRFATIKKNYLRSGGEVCYPPCIEAFLVYVCKSISCPYNWNQYSTVAFCSCFHLDGSKRCGLFWGPGSFEKISFSLFLRWLVLLRKVHKQYYWAFSLR